MKGVSTRWRSYGLMGARFASTRCSTAESRGKCRRGAKTSRFRIRFGRKETNLYLERRQGSPALGTPDVDRWWVNAIDNTPTKPSC